MKNGFILFFGVILLAAVAIVFYINRQKTVTNSSQTKPTQFISEKKEIEVPLPQETDIVRTFFEIIGEHRPSDAVVMMTPINTNDDSTKQAWTVQFNAFKSMSVKNIEPSMQSDWTDNLHSYKVTLQVEMKPEAAQIQPMPNYGWDNGNNTRWIQLEKINGKWMIGGIGTGP